VKPHPRPNLDIISIRYEISLFQPTAHMFL
jgi:hypothetical protein